MHNFLLMRISMVEDGVLLYEELNHGDLRGYFPSSLMNMVIANEVYKEYKRLAMNIIE